MVAATSLLFDVVDGTALAQCFGSHLLSPAVNWNSFNAYLNAELPADVGGVATLCPGGEVKDAAFVGEDSHVHHALPDCWIGEDDQVPLGEVLEHLELVLV